MLDEVHITVNKNAINTTDKYEGYTLDYTDPATIPANIDVADPRPVRLHVAEGPFDILSIYLNLRRNTERDVATAVGGSGYKGVIRYFISLLKIPNLEIHVYPDNDQRRETIVDIASYIAPFHFPFYIHRNVHGKEKDFGVPASQIKEITERVL